jgi:hypothetical protein
MKELIEALRRDLISAHAQNMARLDRLEQLAKKAPRDDRRANGGKK